MSGQWLTLTAPLEYMPSGVSNLVVTCEGEGISIDWLQFKNRQKYFTAVAPKAAAAQPDEQGFIRRWMLLDPMYHEVRSNIILTDTYLNEHLTKQLFKGQFDDNRIPRDGDKVVVKVTKPKDQVVTQTLKWHAMDSEHYNAKLFRCPAWSDDPYHSIFWGVTVIDCPEEMAGVRLAAGSNGASMWWLNGQQVLTLDGDRRMVQDDGISQRLTLKKGRNVLRFALVNGPGLSDMCVRFLDEKGKPVKNYKVTTSSK